MRYSSDGQYVFAPFKKVLIHIKKLFSQKEWIKILSPLQALLITILLASCKNQSYNSNDVFFKEVAPDFTTQVPVTPVGLSYTILFSEGDEVIAPNGMATPAKGKHDFVAYLPINGSSEHGFLYVGHESHDTNSLLGDGGAGTIFEVRRVKGQWEVSGAKHAIDFSGVGGTLRNCGGTLTTSGTILTAEETEPTSNKNLYAEHSYRDTAELNGRRRYLNFGWMVEVDPKSKKALRKLWQMGRYQHEDAQVMPDGKTVYLTDDATPAVLFKFVAETKNNFEIGQLFAYRQSDDAESGFWIPLPMEFDSMALARDVAIRKGATLFVRHEWIEAVGEKLYITETGSDKIDFEHAIRMGGRPAQHFETLKTGNYTYSDPYGRILMLDLNTNKIQPFLNGGIINNDSLRCFSNPDALTSVTINGKTYLVISEDINGANGYHRNGNAKDGNVFNEVYFLDLSIRQPTLKDLRRFMVGPRGCETTGNAFTPDGKNYFVAIQNPARDNEPPFNKSCVIAVKLVE